MTQVENCASKIFISHAWEDKSFVMRLEKELKVLGFTVWVDHSGIRAGDSISINISDALAQCNVLLLIWSRAASVSQWVGQEWGAANSNHKKIIPCVLDDTPLPALLADNAYINFRGFEQGFLYLQQTLNLFEPQSSKTINNRENGDDSMVNDIAVKVDMMEIELKIDRDFNSYTKEEQEHLLRAIGEFLGMNRDLKVKRVRPGSVIMSFKLSPEKAEKLYRAVKSGEFNHYDVIGANIDRIQTTTNEMAWSELFRRIIPDIETTIYRVLGLPPQGRYAHLYKDVIQTFYSRLLENDRRALRAFRGKTEVEARIYLCRIAASVALDALEKERLHTSLKDENDDLRRDKVMLVDPSAPDEHHLVLRKSLDDCLEKVVRGRNRERNILIFKLVIYDGLSPQQIAGIPGFKGMSPHAIEELIMRIRIKVRKCLKKK